VLKISAQSEQLLALVVKGITGSGDGARHMAAWGGKRILQSFPDWFQQDPVINIANPRRRKRTTHSFHFLNPRNDIEEKRELNTPIYF
jgi:hypothetical protein